MQKQEHGLSIFIMQHTSGKHVAYGILPQVHAKSIADTHIATYNYDNNDTWLQQPIAAALHKHGTRHTQTSRRSAYRFASARWQGYLEVCVLVLQDLLCEVDCSKASRLGADQRPSISQTAQQFQ